MVGIKSFSYNTLPGGAAAPIGRVSQVPRRRQQGARRPIATTTSHRLQRAPLVADGESIHSRQLLHPPQPPRLSRRPHRRQPPAKRRAGLAEPQRGAGKKGVRDPRHIRGTHVLGNDGERADQSTAHDWSVQPPTPAQG